MDMIILGCGGSAGVPMLGGPDGAGDWGECDPTEPRNRRTRASVLIDDGPGRRLLVDTGPDLRAQFLAQRIGMIDAVVYTHAHADHILGLDELRAINRIINGPIPVYGTAEVLEEIRTRFDYAFRPWTPPGIFRPILDVNTIALPSTQVVAGMEVQFFAQTHGRIETLGLRAGPMAYCTDVAELDEHALAVLRGVDTWVVDCFQRATHPSHGWLECVLAWRDVIRPRRTVLTHMGPDMDWAWMQANLPAGVEAAYDGLRLSA
ncbi:MBL fold metallo-hydrolase [Komagataeibacter nataicola]|uniref:MBL fold metallo-hydrolase n=1 Tax=Komagataeibacter nataicola TaxID=265960 RepID=A0A9N7H2B2_9PROT|nr:MBL fold metallo-hydrolase [Komagataeibacter nataicola]AQU86613.1 MBL fold metallo-hydrolase [Komagataeibacter nataicola]PYD66767.1 MBL fold metallo-hydrolase [Komagataeibacter nataicola]WEQ56492.1 MBL fold metallo-hydrolase [Komagataeibacter nataicola]WNM08001.1 MBL fold metallo-hydrolase [Komagataeibacter nataicola]GBR22569.1 metal-dependent hydrolase PhnP [Komagataeibacter nataicola NRIC 0616]